MLNSEVRNRILQYNPWLTQPDQADAAVKLAGKLTAIEVKSADLERPRLSRAAHSFIEAYQPERFVVLNRSLETHLTIDNHPVDFQTPEQIGTYCLRLL